MFGWFISLDCGERIDNINLEEMLRASTCDECGGKLFVGPNSANHHAEYAWATCEQAKGQ